MPFAPFHSGLAQPSTTLDWIAPGCLIGALVLLIWLSAIDLKIRLLPNKLVLPFALLGLAFHLATFNRFASWQDVALGGLEGFGSLFILRAIANHLYQSDTLGLGDVKLMGAAGLWLGPDGVMMAMAVGALASLLHGLFIAVMAAWRDKEGLRLGQLALPAGPGFACGIVLTALWRFDLFRPGNWW